LSPEVGGKWDAAGLLQFSPIGRGKRAPESSNPTSETLAQGLSVLSLRTIKSVPQDRRRVDQLNNPPADFFDSAKECEPWPLFKPFS
jgi:hypothetical protein